MMTSGTGTNKVTNFIKLYNSMAKCAISDDKKKMLTLMENSSSSSSIMKGKVQNDLKNGNSVKRRNSYQNAMKQNCWNNDDESKEKEDTNNILTIVYHKKCENEDVNQFVINPVPIAIIREQCKNDDLSKEMHENYSTEDYNKCYEEEQEIERRRRRREQEHLILLANIANLPDQIVCFDAEQTKREMINYSYLNGWDDGIGKNLYLEQQRDESNMNRDIDNIEQTTINTRIENVIKEMLSTEEHYVYNSLRRIVKDYMPEMEKSDVPKGLLGKKLHIFRNIDIIYEKHKKKFLPHLKLCRTVEEIANCFLQHEDIFKLYSLYGKNQPKSYVLVNDYHSYFKMKQDELGDKLDLASYLLTPIQRPAKYKQLLEKIFFEVKKNNNREMAASQLLESAIELVERQLKVMNESLAIDKIFNCNLNLKEQGDLLLRNEFTIISPNRKQYDGMVFLFEHSLLITSIENKIPLFERFNVRACFSMIDMGFTKREHDQFAFDIWYRKQQQNMYTLKASKPDMKVKWTDELHKLLMKQLLADKNRLKRYYEKLGMKSTSIPLPPKSYYSMPINKATKLQRRKSLLTTWYDT